ncbi:MAG: cyclic nucleotide-binding domain-containing protein [Crinalium sp.]
MASREDPHDPQAAQDLGWIEEVELQELASLQWDTPPLSWLSPEQQAQFQSQAETRRYPLGEKIWSTDSSGDQFFILSGKVRLREEGATKPLATLAEGDWFGDLQQFSGSVKAIASSKEVIVGRWDSAFWSHVTSSQREQGEQREQREQGGRGNRGNRESQRSRRSRGGRVSRGSYSLYQLIMSTPLSQYRVILSFLALIRVLLV